VFAVLKVVLGLVIDPDGHIEAEATRHLREEEALHHDDQIAFLALQLKENSLAARLRLLPQSLYGHAGAVAFQAELEAQLLRVRNAVAVVVLADFERDLP